VQLQISEAAAIGQQTREIGLRLRLAVSK
jgi:hypothetical protein